MQQEIGIRDFYFQVVLHIRGMWRHRWHMVFSAWFVCLTGWGAVAVMDDQYIARAQVQIDDPREEIAQFLEKESAEMDVTREAKRILSILLSRENLLTVIRETDLAFRVSNDTQKEEILEVLRAQLSVKQSGNNIYQITHRHSEPRLTRQVVEVLLNLLPLDNVQEIKEGTARTAEEFLGHQVTDYENKVVEAERQLREFKAKHLLALPGKDGGYYERVQSLIQKTEEYSASLRSMMERRDEMRRQLSDLEHKGSSPTDTLDQRIQELKTQLEEQLGKFYIKNGVKMQMYTENHSDIMNLRKSIALLEQQKEEVAGRLRQTAVNPDLWELEANPVYRQLRMALSEVDVEIATVRSNLENGRRRLVKLKEMEATIPSIENELLKLQSYQDLTKKKMLTMLDKEGIARFSGDMAEGLSRYVRFKVLERPSTPVWPVGPDRILFSSVVLGCGLSVGFAIGLFLTVIRPVFDSPGSLKKVLGLPVLGMVSMVDEGLASRWKNSNPIFLLVFLGIFGLYLVVVLMAPNF